MLQISTDKKTWRLQLLPQSPGLAQITLTDLHNRLRRSPLDWHRSHSQTCTTDYATVPWTGTGLIIAQTYRQGSHLILSDLHAGYKRETRHPPHLVRLACWLQERDKAATSSCQTCMLVTRETRHPPHHVRHTSWVLLENKERQTHVSW